MTIRLISLFTLVFACANPVIGMETKVKAENAAKKVFEIQELQEKITEYTTEWELYRTVRTPSVEFKSEPSEWNITFNFDIQKDTLVIFYVHKTKPRLSFEVTYTFEACYNLISYIVTGRPQVNINIKNELVSQCGTYKLVQQGHAEFGRNSIDIYKKKEVDLKAVVTPDKTIQNNEGNILQSLGLGVSSAFMYILYKLWRGR